MSMFLLGYIIKITLTQTGIEIHSFIPKFQKIHWKDISKLTPYYIIFKSRIFLFTFLYNKLQIHNEIIEYLEKHNIQHKFYL